MVSVIRRAEERLVLIEMTQATSVFLKYYMCLEIANEGYYDWPHTSRCCDLRNSFCKLSYRQAQSSFGFIQSKIDSNTHNTVKLRTDQLKVHHLVQQCKRFRYNFGSTWHHPHHLKILYSQFILLFYFNYVINFRYFLRNYFCHLDKNLRPSGDVVSNFVDRDQGFKRKVRDT